jgi:hypothetical protein
VAQLVAHLHGMQGVRGSSPLRSTLRIVLSVIQSFFGLGKKMKKIVSALVIGVLVLAGGINASASDDRAFQYSAKDKTNPPGGIAGEWDLTDVQLGITPEDEFQVFASTKVGVSDAQFTIGGTFVLYIDVNLDRNADFQIDANGVFDPEYVSDRELVDSRTLEVIDCETGGWITPKGDAVAWSFQKSCIKLGTFVNVMVTSTPDGIKFDRLPDGSSWQKFKTSYVGASTCSAKQNQKKITHLGTTWICIKSSGKWAWKDYAPIAAKSAKFLTEKAFYLCKLSSRSGAVLEDAGKTLTLDGAFKFDITEKDYNCVTRAVGMPSSVDRRISITRALDGMQEAKWGRISAFWNYHPDSGLNITFSYN